MHQPAQVDDSYLMFSLTEYFTVRSEFEPREVLHLFTSESMALSSSVQATISCPHV